MVASPNMKIVLHKNKPIGKVLFIVEGTKTEPYILKKIFTQIFDYELDTKLRGKKYKQYNSNTDPFSRVCVINTEESNIKYIQKDDGYLDGLFSELIDQYDFDIDNAAIYYIFDRDDKSNTDSEFIYNLLLRLVNSRDNPNFDKQGLLLLSYPSIESFTLSCFSDNTTSIRVKTGQDLKQYLDTQRINHQEIDENTLLHAADELLSNLGIINGDDFELNLDDLSECNIGVFSFEEEQLKKHGIYRCMSLFLICLLNLGLIEILPADYANKK